MLVVITSLLLEPMFTTAPGCQLSSSSTGPTREFTVSKHGRDQCGWCLVGYRRHHAVLTPTLALALAGLGAFLCSPDVVVVATALPALRTHLGASLSDLEWTINA